MISQIFAPMPAARSRCLSTFVAIARQNLPLLLRYEASHILTLFGITLLISGFFLDSLISFGGTIISLGWASLALAFLATLGQDKIVYGRSRSRLIRQLDEVRRNVGLDDAILPESLEFLESSAQQWERIEHALEAQSWRDQDVLRGRIYTAAHGAMEDIVVLECGSISESGMTDVEADQALAQTVANLRWLADQVDATSGAITTYPRENFDSNGVEPNGVIPEMDDLEDALAKLGRR